MADAPGTLNKIDSVFRRVWIKFLGFVQNKRYFVAGVNDLISTRCR